MNKIQLLELHKLPIKDKLKVVQSLWDDISKEQACGALPPDHKQILDERLNNINAGNSSFSSWKDVQKKYLKE